MIRIAVWAHDLSDAYLRKVTQLGANCIDGIAVPTEPDRGYFDLDALLEIEKKVRSWGLELNRVSLPRLSENFIDDGEGADEELDICCQSLKVLAEAGAPLARVHFAHDTYPWMNLQYQAVHRGGYRQRGESLALGEIRPPPSLEVQQRWWSRVCSAYEKLVPIAEECGIRLMMHPSDTPNADAPFGSLGFHRLIDAFPSRVVGYLYCCGTRAEAGGGPLVLDEINHYGRKGRLFEIHFRNVRGSLATAGGFEEVLLDDGDMNMFKIVRELQKVGFDGCINPDHYPQLEGDGPDSGQALSYSVGYIKALLAALAA
jgi:mannonate dehydratase